MEANIALAIGQYELLLKDLNEFREKNTKAGGKDFEEALSLRREYLDLVLDRNGQMASLSSGQQAKADRLYKEYNAILGNVDAEEMMTLELGYYVKEQLSLLRKYQLVCLEIMLDCASNKSINTQEYKNILTVLDKHQEKAGLNKQLIASARENFPRKVEAKLQRKKSDLALLQFIIPNVSKLFEDHKTKDLVKSINQLALTKVSQLESSEILRNFIVTHPYLIEKITDPAKKQILAKMLFEQLLAENKGFSTDSVLALQQQRAIALYVSAELASKTIARLVNTPEKNATQSFTGSSLEIYEVFITLRIEIFGEPEKPNDTKNLELLQTRINAAKQKEANALVEERLKSGFSDNPLEKEAQIEAIIKVLEPKSIGNIFSILVEKEKQGLLKNNSSLLDFCKAFCANPQVEQELSDKKDYKIFKEKIENITNTKVTRLEKIKTNIEDNLNKAGNEAMKAVGKLQSMFEKIETLDSFGLALTTYTKKVRDEIAKANEVAMIETLVSEANEFFKVNEIKPRERTINLPGQTNDTRLQKEAEEANKLIAQRESNISQQQQVGKKRMDLERKKIAKIEEGIPEERKNYKVLKKERENSERAMLDQFKSCSATQRTKRIAEFKKLKEAYGNAVSVQINALEKNNTGTDRERKINKNIVKNLRIALVNELKLYDETIEKLELLDRNNGLNPIEAGLNAYSANRIDAFVKALSYADALVAVTLLSEDKKKEYINKIEKTLLEDYTGQGQRARLLLVYDLLRQGIEHPVPYELLRTTEEEVLLRRLLILEDDIISPGENGEKIDSINLTYEGIFKNKDNLEIINQILKQDPVLPSRGNRDTNDLIQLINIIRDRKDALDNNKKLQNKNEELGAATFAKSLPTTAAVKLAKVGRTSTMYLGSTALNFGTSDSELRIVQGLKKIKKMSIELNFALELANNKKINYQSSDETLNNIDVLREINEKGTHGLLNDLPHTYDPNVTNLFFGLNNTKAIDYYNIDDHLLLQLMVVSGNKNDVDGGTIEQYFKELEGLRRELTTLIGSRTPTANELKIFNDIDQKYKELKIVQRNLCGILMNRAFVGKAQIEIRENGIANNQDDFNKIEYSYQHLTGNPEAKLPENTLMQSLEISNVENALAIHVKRNPDPAPRADDAFPLSKAIDNFKNACKTTYKSVPMQSSVLAWAGMTTRDPETDPEIINNWNNVRLGFNIDASYIGAYVDYCSYALDRKMGIKEGLITYYKEMDFVIAFIEKQIAELKLEASAVNLTLDENDPIIKRYTDAHTTLTNLRANKQDKLEEQFLETLNQYNNYFHSDLLIDELESMINLKDQDLNNLIRDTLLTGNFLKQYIFANNIKEGRNSVAGFVYNFRSITEFVKNPESGFQASDVTKIVGRATAFLLGQIEANINDTTKEKFIGENKRLIETNEGTFIQNEVKIKSIDHDIEKNTKNKQTEMLDLLKDNEEIKSDNAILLVENDEAREIIIDSQIENLSELIKISKDINYIINLNDEDTKNPNKNLVTRVFSKIQTQIVALSKENPLISFALVSLSKLIQVGSQPIVKAYVRDTIKQIIDNLYQTKDIEQLIKNYTLLNEFLLENESYIGVYNDNRLSTDSLVKQINTLIILDTSEAKFTKSIVLLKNFMTDNGVFSTEPIESAIQSRLNSQLEKFNFESSPIGNHIAELSFILNIANKYTGDNGIKQAIGSEVSEILKKMDHEWIAAGTREEIVEKISLLQDVIKLGAQADVDASVLVKAKGILKMAGAVATQPAPVHLSEAPDASASVVRGAIPSTAREMMNLLKELYRDPTIDLGFTLEKGVEEFINNFVKNDSLDFQDKVTNYILLQAFLRSPGNEKLLSNNSVMTQVYGARDQLNNKAASIKQNSKASSEDKKLAKQFHNQFNEIATNKTLIQSVEGKEQPGLDEVRPRAESSSSTSSKASDSKNSI